MSLGHDYPVWPGWETVRLIGRGSSGTVYEIQRTVVKSIEKAALKVISIPQNEADIEDLRAEGLDDDSITKRFVGYREDIIREYSMMASLKNEKNIVRCDDVMFIQHDNGIGWDILIRMELLNRIDRTLPVDPPEEEVVQLGLDICCALMACGKKNILHRDIKPQNIFVSSRGEYKLGDFGIAKAVERTTSGTKTGTYKYMAPEVYNNEPYGPKADIYSLGLVLYWLLNERRTPFVPMPPEVPTAREEDDARARRMRGEQFPPPKHGSRELKAIVMKACAYDPEYRFQNAEAMYLELQNILDKTVETNVIPQRAKPVLDKNAPKKRALSTSLSVVQLS